MENYVKVAISKKIKEIGFSCHLPYEFLPEEVPRQNYAMSLDTLNQKYFQEIDGLKQTYKDQIIIKTALEIDYINWLQQPIDEFFDKYSEKLDYVLGSVHMLKTEEFVWSVDDRKFIHQYEKYGVDAIYDFYLDELTGLIENGRYTVLSHLDLPKKFGFRPSDKNHYLNRVSDILDLLKKNNMGIECSTGGLRKKVNEVYPEQDILKLALKKEVPIITSSDAHKPEEVGYNFDFLYQYLIELGVTKIYRLENHKLMPFPLIHKHS
jgi:histidinol-phosphatase (PHP family)